MVALGIRVLRVRPYTTAKPASTHLILVLANVAHQHRALDEVLDVLVHLRRDRHGRRRVLHVRIVPRQELSSAAIFKVVRQPHLVTDEQG